MPGAQPRTRFAAIEGGAPVRMFLFFSNRLGCLGSLALSVAITVILVLIFIR